MESIKWDIRRSGRRWTRDEFDSRLHLAPEKIEFVNGIFASERQRLIVLGMLLENLGMDAALQFGSLDDWRDAIESRESGVF